ncbi:MAG: porin [Bacteroidota bacterium]
MMKKKLLAAAMVSFSATLMAQPGASIEDSTVQKSGFTWSLFADTYYSYDFNKPENHTRPSFLYNHNRHNEINLNLALVKASYSAKNVRPNVGLMAGTYAQYNLAAEQELMQHVYEANVGVKISKKSNLWIDAGIMPSHIGYESAISKDNWTLTRSMAAENSPYYEAGAKITYTTKNDKVVVSGMVLNGWQRIQRPVANNTLAVGTQLIIKPNSTTTLNWSTFIGNDKPDSVKQWRYFNNLYGIFQLTNTWGLTLGFDIGQEQVSKGSSKLNSWYSPTVVVRFSPTANWAIAARGEYYSDKNGVIIATGTTNGFKTFGASLNVDRKINEHFWWRTEIRNFSSKDAIFAKQNGSTKNNATITTSFAISF